MTFNILYCSDNNYAPYLGVSIASVLESNRDAEEIVFYVVSDRISEDNLNRLQKQVERYGDHRRLVLVDGQEWIDRLAEIHLLPYRGGLTANLRLFFTEFIEDDVDRLLYLDCDTLICGRLDDLFSQPMEDAIGAVVLESLVGHEYKRLIGFAPQEHYFNSGMILFDVKNWISQGCDATLYTYMKDPHHHSPNNDQDFLNVLLKERSVVLSPKYNFQTIHQVYSDNVYFANYSEVGYYKKEEIAEARKAPVILHAYRFLGQFPWHKRALHPWRKLWWEQVMRSEWSDLAPRANRGISFRMERALYRSMPKRMFLPIFKRWQAFYFRRKMKLLRKNAEKEQVA